MGNSNIKLFGYIPKEGILGGEIHDAYRIVTTDREDFSPWEPIRVWCDLLINGIFPKDAILLGIEGGRIAAIEYRLGLALGAIVGIVENSGRAANDIFKDDYWKNHKNLHKIPDEAESFWAFFNNNTTK
jgi:hypothetical protein